MKAGVVRIREEFKVELPWHRYHANWEQDPSGPDRPAGEAVTPPGWSDVEDAIRWARQRAPVVRILGLGRGDGYSAGERDDPDEPARRWPGVPRRPAGDRVADYGGEVAIWEERPWYWPANEFTATWTEGDAKRGVVEVFGELELAIDWARERAPVVLVAEAARSWGAVPSYQLWSAGDQDPVDERLPRLRPRAGEETLLWECREYRAAQTLSPSEYRDRLRDALETNPRLLAVSCSVDGQPPTRTVSRPAGVVSGQVSEEQLAAIRAAQAAEAAQAEREPTPDDWVTITVRVAAPNRPLAESIARDAIRSAHTSSKEYWRAPSSAEAITQIDA